MTVAVAADFEFPDVPRYLAAAPITHVAGTKVVPALLRGGTVHLLKGFEPEKFLATIEREKINFTLMVPTMIYVLLDHPRLDKTDLSSLELILYGASPMSPTRLVEGLERIGPVFSQLYGQTECYPVSVLRKADHDAAAARAVRLLRLSHRLLQREPARRRQQRSGAGRGGRDLRARAARHGAILEASRADRRDLQGRLAAYRRRRARRRARLPLYRRSQEGHDRVAAASTSFRARSRMCCRRIPTSPWPR